MELIYDLELTPITLINFYGPIFHAPLDQKGGITLFFQSNRSGLMKNTCDALGQLHYNPNA